MKFRFKHLFKQLSLLVFLSPALYSCISDDLENCITQGSLQFSYTLNANHTDEFSSQVDYLDLYFYDQSNQFIEKKHLLQPELKNGNTLSLEMEEGDYKIIVWGNQNTTDYQLTDQPTWGDMLLHLKNQAGDVQTQPGSLFHGLIDFTMAFGANPTQSVELTKNTNKLHVKLSVENSIHPIDVGDCTIEVTGSNGDYNYDNTLAAVNPLLNYIPTYSQKDTYTIQADYTLMRLFDQDDTRIKITETGGRVLFDDSLTAKLLANPQINSNTDLDRYDEYTLGYSITIDPSTGAWVEIKLISINDWDATEQGSGI